MLNPLNKDTRQGGRTLPLTLSVRFEFLILRNSSFQYPIRFKHPLRRQALPQREHSAPSIQTAASPPEPRFQERNLIIRLTVISKVIPTTLPSLLPLSRNQTQCCNLLNFADKSHRPLSSKNLRTATAGLHYPT